MKVIEAGHVYELDQLDEHRSHYIAALIATDFGERLFDALDAYAAAKDEAEAAGRRSAVHRLVLDQIALAQRRLVFVKREGDPEHPDHPGTQTQEVLRAEIDALSCLIDRTLHCHHCLAWPGNERIVTAMAEAQRQMRLALLFHEERALERKVDKAGWKPERAPTAGDGHFPPPGEAEVKSAGADIGPEALAAASRGFDCGGLSHGYDPSCPACAEYLKKLERRVAEVATVAVNKYPPSAYPPAPPCRACEVGKHEECGGPESGCGCAAMGHYSAVAAAQFSASEALQQGASYIAEASVLLSRAWNYLARAPALSGGEKGKARDAFRHLVSKLDTAVAALRDGDAGAFVDALLAWRA